MSVPRLRRRPLLLRILRARVRLFASAAIGIAVTVVLSFVTRWPLATRALTGWDIGVALYLSLAAHVMATSTVDVLRNHAAEQDEGQGAILVLSVSAALASLVAIFGELRPNSAGGGERQAAHVFLAGVTILLSWAFIHTIFALHYAYEFYDVHVPGGLAFPGDDEPDYWDFVYFSFIIGMTSQVSDVAVTSKGIRRIVVAHGVLSFIFNVALLALTINLAASAI
jgi:uncharacterized membrane protein